MTQRIFGTETQRTQRFRPWERTFQLPACPGCPTPCTQDACAPRSPRRKILSLAGKDFSSRNLRALRGFAVNPGLDFHREAAKHAKKTRRTLVWLQLCCSVFIGGCVLCNLRRDSYRLIIHGRDARATMASWHGRPGHDTKLDRLVNFVSTK